MIRKVSLSIAIAVILLLIVKRTIQEYKIKLIETLELPSVHRELEMIKEKRDAEFKLEGRN